VALVAAAVLAVPPIAQAATQPSSAPPVPAPIELPGGAGGIGFDDLGFARGIGRVLVPAGRSGALDLIDPATHKVEQVSGFRASARFGGGHGEGTTSADEGGDLLFAIDRTSERVVAVDSRAQAVVADAALGGAPDYVRYVGTTGEVWVTQPDKDRIEIFKLSKANPPRLEHDAFLAVPGGPESLVIDGTRGRAYTNLWTGSSVALDLRSRRAIAQWKNGCEASRGIALDERRALLFVGCAEGKASALDLAHDGTVVGHLESGSGVDIIAYDPEAGHLYLPGARSATLAVIGVSAKGAMSLLGTVATAHGSHCATVDDRHQVWVCDPDRGRLLLFTDAFPPTR
jgi:hypothetical protein